MSRCWEALPANRPTFSELRQELEQVLAGSKLDPRSNYAYIRECTQDIPEDYVLVADEVINLLPMQTLKINQKYVIQLHQFFLDNNCFH